MCRLPHSECRRHRHDFRSVLSGASCQMNPPSTELCSIEESGSCVQRGESVKRKKYEERKHRNVEHNYAKQSLIGGSRNRIRCSTAPDRNEGTKWGRPNRST